MEGQQAAQAADTGVTETADAPMPNEASPASGDQGDNGSSSQGVDRALSPANVRIQKLANESRQYREQVTKLRQEMESLTGARQLDEMLRRDPSKARVIMDILQGRTPSQSASAKDPFEGYQPHEAEAMRAAMEFKEWKAQQEQMQQQNYAQSIEENNGRLEDLFAERLTKDGFIGKDGSYDEHEVKVIAGAVLTQALSIARDPNRVSERELLQAYEDVSKGTKSLEKRALKNTVRSSPPPSGSNRNPVPIGKTKESDEQRIQRMVKELQSG